MLSVRAVVETFASKPARAALADSPEAMERLVSSSIIISTLAELEEVRPNSLVLVSQQLATSTDVILDLVLRHSARLRVSCVLIEGEAALLPLATSQLAARHQIALWQEPRPDLIALHSHISNLVQTPELAGAGIIRAISGALLQPASDVGEIVSRVGKELTFPVALVGPDGRPVAGAELGSAPAIADRLASVDLRHIGVEIVIDAELGQTIVLVPAFPLAAEPTQLWLGAKVPRGLDGRSGHILTALRVCSLGLSAHLAQTSLSYERRNRELGTLLEEILQLGADISMVEAERAAAVGWQLWGWQVSIHIRAEGAIAQLPTSSLARSLTQALAHHGIDANPVVNGPAVRFWVTTQTRPSAVATQTLAHSLEEALKEIETSYPAFRLRAGIGSAHEGPAGISHSLDEARHALAFAESKPGRTVVQSSDSMTANRLIRSWLPDSSAREVVSTVLDPLRSADSTGQLIATLRVFLDQESNVSQAAELLHIHRNTAIQRIRRIRDLLEIDLDDPHDRLAARLALRLAD